MVEAGEEIVVVSVEGEVRREEEEIVAVSAVEVDREGLVLAREAVVGSAADHEVHQEDVAEVTNRRALGHDCRA